MFPKMCINSFNRFIPTHRTYLYIFVLVFSVHFLGLAIQAEQSSRLESTGSNVASKEEYYSISPYKLVSLAGLEQDIYAVMAVVASEIRYFNTLYYNIRYETLLDHAEDYLKSYEDGVLKPNADIPARGTEMADRVATHPLMIYRMIRRLNTLKEFIFGDAEKSNFDCPWCEKLKLIKDVRFPDIQDELDALRSILRIQLYYNITSSNEIIQTFNGDSKRVSVCKVFVPVPADELTQPYEGLSVALISQGIFASTTTNCGLTIPDVVDIGLYANRLRSYVVGIEWLELAISRLKREENENKEDLHEVEEHLNLAIENHNSVWEMHNPDLRSMTNLFVSKLTVTPNEQIEATNMNRIKAIDILRGQGEQHGILDELGDTEDWPYKSLCSGNNYQTAEEKRQLHCWYERDVHAYWKINPLKVELLHSNPKLIQVYNFVSDAFIGKVLGATLPLMSVAKTVNLTTNLEEVSKFRLAVNTWVTNEHKSSSHMHSFLRRVELFTGLDVTHAAESLQTAGYSPGGHYGCHYDCLFNNELNEKSGERMATFMLYLNNVALGGSTAYPRLGTAAVPVKGSAVFWYDTKWNGECDHSTLHGACPVILGRKYVANLWITSNYNFLRRKCLLNSNE